MSKSLSAEKISSFFHIKKHPAKRSGKGIKSEPKKTAWQVTSQVDVKASALPSRVRKKIRERPKSRHGQETTKKSAFSPYFASGPFTFISTEDMYYYCGVSSDPWEQVSVTVSNGYCMPSGLLTPDASPESDANLGCDGPLEEREVAESPTPFAVMNEDGETASSEFTQVTLTLTARTPGESNSQSSDAPQQDPTPLPTSEDLPSARGPEGAEAPAPCEAAVSSETSVSNCEDASQAVGDAEVKDDETSQTSDGACVESAPATSVAEADPSVSNVAPPTADPRKAPQGRKRGRGRGSRSASSRVPKNDAKVAKDAPVSAKSKKNEDSKSNSKITDYFPVRRSDRKCESRIKMEHQRKFEEYVTSNCEDGLKVDVIDGKGRGVIATKKFEPGDFVVEYAGDLIDMTIAKQKETDYASNSSVGCYMYYFHHRNKQYCVDATAETPQLGRLINHSRTSSNCRTRVLEVNNRPHLIFVAARHIKEGEELLYDYGDRSKSSLSHFPWLKS